METVEIVLSFLVGILAICVLLVAYALTKVIDAIEELNRNLAEASRREG